jgi:hypothetical protein
MFLLNLWGILLILTKYSLSFNPLQGSFFVFPLIVICTYVLFLFWPFHCFYNQFRKSIILTFLKNLLPVGKTGVRFRDFMFGDILTSLTRPFATLTLAFCLFKCGPCRSYNERNTCDRNSILAFIFMLAPFVIRFFQCINRYYYTKMAWPHIANAIKYCGGISNVTISWLYSIKIVDTNVFISVGLGATAYLIYWDIYMDWNLARFPSKNFGLRDRLTYPKWMYYGAIVSNIFLRFTWTTSLFSVPVDDELKNFILSILEVYRRTQWSLFRVENENTNNPEKYRNVLDIPELPLD